jgi:hypothetical protein
VASDVVAALVQKFRKYRLDARYGEYPADEANAVHQGFVVAAFEDDAS